MSETTRAEAMADAFVRRLQARDLTVGIVGLGYVGVPLAEGFVAKGLRVVGYEPDVAKVSALAAGESYISHIDPVRVKLMAASGLFEPTSDASRLAHADAILLCVPTPLAATVPVVVDTRNALARAGVEAANARKA